ncbi:protein translocase subunit SecD [Candidatus Wolfebacteria bacterium]|nr:protein translocase subunit SecD [Candidatus Wolfebacteria bacterium]
MRKNSVILLIGIIFLAVVAGIFVYPQWLGKKYLPWRLGLDLIGGTHLTYDIDLSGVESGDKDSVANGLRDVIERRVNLFGVREPQVVTAKNGDSYRLVVELAGIHNPQEAIDQIGRTAFLEFRELPAQTFPEKEIKDENKQPIVDFISTELTGRYLVKAQMISSQLGQPEISLTFNGEGAKLFEDITGRNVGRPLAIYIDNKLISAPTVNDKIIGGKAVITGVAAKEAQSLANLLNAGALPAPVNLIGQYTVGATLGNEFLQKSIAAGVLGTILIIVFMIIYYRGFGFFASLALLVYIVLTSAVFKGVSITMTLSGIAGFILSIGMAVDANILIFERTKEEIKKGLSKITAVEEGFRRAWPSIRDSNITTIISSIILYYFTSSFVKGFALALLIGVLVSMFSAIMITRTILRVFIK